MAQFNRTPVSRAIISGIVLLVVLVSALQYHLSRSKKELPPTLSAAASGPPITLKAPADKPATDPLRAALLVTETPAGKQTQPPTPGPAKTADSAKTVADVQLPATAEIISTAKAQVAKGDLLAARKTLNDPLATGGLSGADADAVKKQLADLNQTLVFSNRLFPTDPLGGVYKIKSGENLTAIGMAHQVPYQILMQMNRISDPAKVRVGQKLKVINGPIFGVVSKTKFTLDLYFGAPGGVGSTYLCTYPVGLGTENSTPTGTWVVTTKLPHPSYDAPDGKGEHFDAGDPKNPIGSYWMGLQGVDGQAVGAQSYGIHGTIDPASIGKMSSMGCIRLKNDDVDQVAKLLVSAKSNVVVRE